MKSPAQQNGQRWVGDKIYMGHSQGAYGAERAALARDLETDARRQTTPERVTIFTDAQAAVKRMASEEPNPDRCRYATQAKGHIATLRRARPDITIELRWCPAHQGAPANETAGEWAKLVAEKSDARGVEWKQYTDRCGRRPMPLPSSLSHLERDVSVKRWLEAKM